MDCSEALPVLLMICSMITAIMVAIIKGKNIKSKKDMKIIKVCINIPQSRV